MAETTGKFHDNFARRFQEQGWSQHSLAEKSGVSQSLIGKYLRREATPTLFNLERLAGAMRTKPDELLGKTLEETGIRVPMDLLALLESLDEPRSEAIRRLLLAFSKPMQPDLSAPKRRILELLPTLDDSQAAFYLNMIEKELSVGARGAKAPIKAKKER